MTGWCWEAVGAYEILRGLSVKCYNGIAEELTYKPTPSTYALLYLLHDSDNEVLWIFLLYASRK